MNALLLPLLLSCSLSAPQPPDSAEMSGVYLTREDFLAQRTTSLTTLWFMSKCWGPLHDGVGAGTAGKRLLEKIPGEKEKTFAPGSIYGFRNVNRKVDPKRPAPEEYVYDPTAQVYRRANRASDSTLLLFGDEKWWLPAGFVEWHPLFYQRAGYPVRSLTNAHLDADFITEPVLRERLRETLRHYFSGIGSVASTERFFRKTEGVAVNAKKNDQ